MLLLILDRPLLFDNPRARLHFDLHGASTVRWGREIVADIVYGLNVRGIGVRFSAGARVKVSSTKCRDRH